MVYDKCVINTLQLTRSVEVENNRNEKIMRSQQYNRIICWILFDIFFQINRLVWLRPQLRSNEIFYRRVLAFPSVFVFNFKTIAVVSVAPNCESNAAVRHHCSSAVAVAVLMAVLVNCAVAIVRFDWFCHWVNVNCTPMWWSFPVIGCFDCRVNWVNRVRLSTGHVVMTAVVVVDDQPLALSYNSNYLSRQFEGAKENEREKVRKLRVPVHAHEMICTIYLKSPIGKYSGVW